MWWINDLGFAALMIFMAEFADKTMLATVSLAITSRRVLAIILISTFAFILANLIALATALILKYMISYEILRVISSILFVSFGLVFIFKKGEHREMAYKGLWATLILVFTSELGDKTQLSLIAIALRSKCLIAVLFGSALGYLTLNLLAVAFLSKIIKVEASKAMKVIGALFIVLGILVFFNII